MREWEKRYYYVSYVPMWLINNKLEFKKLCVFAR